MLSFSQQRRKAVDEGESRAGRCRLRAPKREGVSAQFQLCSSEVCCQENPGDENER